MKTTMKQWIDDIIKNNKTRKAIDRHLLELIVLNLLTTVSGL